MSSQSSTILLTRLLGLKENSPFLLVLDSLAQSAHHLILEFINRSASNTRVIYLSFETINKPNYATDYVDLTSNDISPAKVIQLVRELVTTTQPSSITSAKTLIVVDSLNYIPTEELSSFISGCIIPGTSLLGVFHTNIPQSQPTVINHPSPINILSFIASSIFEVDPLLDEEKIDEEALEIAINKLQTPINVHLNSSTYKLTLTNRRKSGRSLTYRYVIDSAKKSIEVYTPALGSEEAREEDEALLKDLTTFNLTTNSKQKLAREQVDLPFMQAQEALGSSGGAIVYEFEKDDDYDEEDPFEDPF